MTPFPARSRAPLALVLAALLGGCHSSSADVGPAPSAQPAAVSSAELPSPPADEEGDACRARAKQIAETPALPGAPGFEKNRVAILGRARGEPMVFTRAPSAVDPASLSEPARRDLETFAKGRPGGRIVSLVKKLAKDKPTLRTLLLREAYTYAEDPADALALAQEVKLADLFDEPEIFLQRGARTFKLTRVQEAKEVEYVLAENAAVPEGADLAFGRGRTKPLAAMRLHFGDRVALTEAELAAPLHRDFVALADADGFERATLVHTTSAAILADLRHGDLTVRAVLDTDGAAVRLACLTGPPEERAAARAFRERTAPRRRALAAIRESITSLVTEGMRFDRPHDEKGPDRDGQLRPMWMTAYLQGRTAFSFEGQGYPVFDTLGRAWPPEVCVDFVLDSFERAGGTWFAPKGEKLGRTVGRFTWIPDMRETRGVIGFGERADKHPELFEVRRFAGKERAPFSERARFFGFLAANAASIQPGDVIAIHGMKRDDRIHQHAIFVERTDPLTGFPYGLADQMRRPRRRTWEGIMAEAPKRSLLYRVHPKDIVFQSIDPGEPVAAR